MTDYTPEALDPIGAVEKRIENWTEERCKARGDQGRHCSTARTECFEILHQVIKPREALVSELLKRARAVWDSVPGQPDDRQEAIHAEALLALAEILGIMEAGDE